MNFLRRIATSTPLRRVLLNPRVRRFLASVLALRFLPGVLVVNRSVAFLYANIRRVGIRDYRLRRSSVPIVVRHGRGAIELLHEVFRSGCYVPPQELAGLIPAPPRILDVGANVGAYSAFARQHWPDATITAIEADPDNVAALRRFVELDGTGRVEPIAAAASINSEPIEFRAGLGSGSRIGAGGRLVDAVDLLEMLHDVDLAKIDIEGGEWPILADPRLGDGGPLVLVMEYHRRFVDDSGARAAARGFLEAAGFDVGFERPNVWGHGTLWAWRS